MSKKYVSVFSWLLLAAFWGIQLTGCDSAGDGQQEEEPQDKIVAGVNFTRLFAPPTEAEKQAVLDDWASRQPTASGVQIEADLEIGDHVILVFSHVVDGNRHYGAVRIPANAEGNLPVLMVHHGGDGGVNVAEYAQVLDGASAAGDFDVSGGTIQVMPSYRSEPLDLSAYQQGLVFTSEGEPSPWDRDVDDAIALLNVVLEQIPQADPDRVAVLGVSRGGGVALLHAIRDVRVNGVVDFFGPTNFFGSMIQGLAEYILTGGEPLGLPGEEYLTHRVLFALRDGEISYEEARLELLKRSPRWFVEQIPPYVQIHHGVRDLVVLVEQSDELAQALEDAGRTAPEFQYYRYPEGKHDISTLPGSLERTNNFLDIVYNAAVATKLLF